ncbi:substrate-binding domain-containing protein [Celeribacter sp.]|uniref:substrate-binding domain-containing protein n=1 Tax=Celeribacter sp. TaxID=1890673 RepID=UPI003A8DF306
MKHTLMGAVAAAAITVFGFGGGLAHAADGEGFSSNSRPAFVGSEEETYYLLTFLSGYDFWTSYYEGFMDAGRQLGVNTKYMGATTADISEQIRVFEQIMAFNPAGIMINPSDGDPLSASAERANELDIPLVIGENPIPGAQVAMWINHNEDLMTRKAADYIGEALGGKGEIAVMETVGQVNLDNRSAAFTKNMETYWPDIKIVARTNPGHDEIKGAQDASSLIQAHPDLDFIFTVNPTAAMGAVTALQEASSEVKVLTFDTNPNVLDYIKEGKLEAAIMPDPYTFGYMGLLALYLDRHGLLDPMWDYTNDRPAFDIPLMNTGSSVVTQENADYFYSDKYKERRQSDGYDMQAKDLNNPDLPGYWD